MSLLPTQWPDALPGLGPRGVCALTMCGCGRERTFATYGGQPYCGSCARYIAWGLQPEASAPESKSSNAPAGPAGDDQVEW